MFKKKPPFKKQHLFFSSVLAECDTDVTWRGELFIYIYIYCAVFRNGRLFFSCVLLPSIGRRGTFFCVRMRIEISLSLPSSVAVVVFYFCVGYIRTRIPTGATHDRRNGFYIDMGFDYWPVAREIGGWGEQWMNEWNDSKTDAPATPSVDRLPKSCCSFKVLHHFLLPQFLLVVCVYRPFFFVLFISRLNLVPLPPPPSSLDRWCNNKRALLSLSLFFTECAIERELFGVLDENAGFFLLRLPTVFFLSPLRYQKDTRKRSSKEPYNRRNVI